MWFCFIFIFTLDAYSQCENVIRTIVNELEYEIDIENNQIIFDLACDQCTYDDNGEACMCKERCEGKVEFEDCRSKCQNITNEQAEEYCLEECNQEHSDYLNCIKECGDSNRERTITNSAYAFNLWWTHSILETQSGAPDESFISSSLSNGNVTKIIHDSTQDFMNESISYCFQYEVFLIYDDGTCCR